MATNDWRPWEAASLLRQAREAATPTADLALIEAALQAALAEMEVTQALAKDDTSRVEHVQRCIERITWAGEHLARHAAMEGDGNDIPY